MRKTKGNGGKTVSNKILQGQVRTAKSGRSSQKTGRWRELTMKVEEATKLHGLHPAREQGEEENNENNKSQRSSKVFQFDCISSCKINAHLC